jgi:hypothetical protein
VASVLPKRTGKKAPGQPLSERQIRDLREPLVDALRTYFDLADKLLSAVVKGHQTIVIWSDMEQSELDVLADAWLHRATKSPRAAKRAQAAIDTHQRLFIPGIVITPRLVKTFMVIIENGLTVRP